MLAQAVPFYHLSTCEGGLSYQHYQDQEKQVLPVSSTNLRVHVNMNTN